MLNRASPATCELVLLGGGHSHVEVLRRFAMKPAPGVRITLIAREAEAPYSGMLPGHLAGDYAHGECHVDLRPLCRFAGARLIHGEAVGLDLAAQTVRCSDRPAIAFDLLSIDVGGRPLASGIAGAERAIAVKPVDSFLDGLAELARPEVRSIAVIGGGAGSVEVAIALRQKLGPQAPRLRLLTDGDDILPSHSAGVRRRMRRALAAHEVELRLGCRVVAVEPGCALCAGGEAVEADRCILVTPVAPPHWLAEAGLAVDEHGFVAVDEGLRSISHPSVFAAGDAAAFMPRPLPKAGVYAVRQGPVLAENLRRAAEGRELSPYRPQRRVLALLRSGEGRAVASWGPFAAEGGWVWRWKDRIDRRWISRYCDLPAMPAEEGGEMRCGGCAAKIASPVLRRALAGVAPASGADVLIGLAAPDDAAAILPPAGAAVVQSVDQFRPFVDDPHLFARIAANHCLNDIYAMGARPHSALALATVPFGSERAMENDLRALLAGAGATLQEAGVALIGGHSGEGPELAFGLAVTGFAAPDRLWRKSGLRAGEALVLTKPLGTGALFAAEMRGAAPPAAIEAALLAMRQSNGPAAAILSRFGVAGCTDVSGFGFLGHLVEMLEASGLDAALEAASIPALEGARQLLARGMASTLQPANEAAFAPFVLGAPEPLLFDPQTAGGLLAGLPAASAQDCLAALRGAGFQAAIVGALRPMSGERPRVLLDGLTPRAERS